MTTLRERARSVLTAVWVITLGAALTACGSSNPLGGGEISG
ncbi:MAG: hypothetical protein K0R68_2740, partial [Mycobacterium sp.]|nr:hypothetical protein [Mycobacterium sp.]